MAAFLDYNCMRSNGLSKLFFILLWKNLSCKLNMTLESLLHQRARERERDGDGRRCGKNKIAAPPTASLQTWLEPVLLKVSGFLVARDAHSYGMVPATRRYGAAVGGTAVTHALSTGAAVMDGETGVKLALALMAATDVLIRNPVRWPRCVFNQAWWWRHSQNTWLSAKLCMPLPRIILKW